MVIGGGIVGCSTAYALARAGWDEVVLVERDQLTSGTTWHSAGFVLHVQPTPGLVGVVGDTMSILRDIEDETGMATGFHQTGQMRLALSEDRMTGLLRQAAVARAQGTRVAHLTPEEAYERFPWFDPEGVVGAVLYPDDGRANPTDTTMALAHGARQRGVQIRERTRVTRVVVTDGRVVAVETDAGAIATNVVVNCTGMWGRQVAARNAVPVPLQAMPHYYVVTTELPGFETSLSGVSVSDEYVYVGPEGKGLLVGFFEPGGTPWAADGIPEDASFTTLAEDWDHLGKFYEARRDGSRFSPTPGSVSSSRAQRASPPTASTTSDGRQASTTTGWRRGSTRAGFSPGLASVPTSPARSRTVPRRRGCWSSTHVAHSRTRPTLATSAAPPR